MTKQNNLRIGDIVEVRAIASFNSYHTTDENKNNRLHRVPSKTPKYAYVTGFGKKCSNGVVERDYEYGVTFTPQEYIDVIKVRFNSKGREYNILPKDILVMSRVHSVNNYILGGISTEVTYIDKVFVDPDLRHKQSLKWPKDKPAPWRETYRKEALAIKCPECGRFCKIELDYLVCKEHGKVKKYG
jgi:hypothetical protein